MASEKEVACLKKELAEMRAEFRKFRDKTRGRLKKAPEGDVEGQEFSFGCSPCITWTAI